MPSRFAYPNIAQLHQSPFSESANPSPQGFGTQRFEEWSETDRVRLASNENPIGCSPHVTLAITAKLGELSRYPDGAGATLKKGIADFYHLTAEQVILGNGSNELLNLIAHTFASRQGGILFSQYAVSQYQWTSLAIDATPIEIPAKNFGHDLDAMLQAVNDNPNTKIVFISNPNNPTGTLLTKEEIRSFVKKIPSEVIVVIDEAYFEFAPQAGSLALVDDFDNVVILRTFSKAYGLAGLRIGYAITSLAIADLLNRTRQAFNTNVLANAAALAALHDQDFVKAYIAMNEEQKQTLYKGFDSLGLAFVKSPSNFILVNVGEGNEVYQKLLEQGVVVRPMAGYGLPEWIRVSIGVPEENNRFLDTLSQVLN